jgi:hypothetical protein
MRSPVDKTSRTIGVPDANNNPGTSREVAQIGERARRFGKSGQRWPRSDNFRCEPSFFQATSSAQHWSVLYRLRSTKRAFYETTGWRAFQPEEIVKQNAMLALSLVLFLTMPAFAGSLNVGGKPIILAEGVNVRTGGVGVGVGERHQYRGHAGLYMSERGHRRLHDDRDHR